MEVRTKPPTEAGDVGSQLDSVLEGCDTIRMAASLGSLFDFFVYMNVVVHDFVVRPLCVDLFRVVEGVGWRAGVGASEERQ